jgi:hypothetical protein
VSGLEHTESGFRCNYHTESALEKMDREDKAQGSDAVDGDEEEEDEYYDDDFDGEKYLKELQKSLGKSRHKEMNAIKQTHEAMGGPGGAPALWQEEDDYGAEYGSDINNEQRRLRESPLAADDPWAKAEVYRSEARSTDKSEADRSASSDLELTEQEDPDDDDDDDDDDDLLSHNIAADIATAPRRRLKLGKSLGFLGEMSKKIKRIFNRIRNQVFGRSQEEKKQEEGGSAPASDSADVEARFLWPRSGH